MSKTGSPARYRTAPRKRWMHRDQLGELIARGISLGCTAKSRYLWEWNVSGTCTNPRYVALSSRPSPDEIDPTHGKAAMGLDMDVPCRQCQQCLAARARLWTRRAQSETALAPRTWFGTITLSPDNHHRVIQLARVREAESAGVDFDALGYGEKFHIRHGIISAELTRYVKRVRKNSGAKLRYLMVAEAHKSGDPHYHVLLHERRDGGSVRHKALTDAWQWGFTKWNLTDASRARYVCKYLAKHAMARVRASLHYGDHGTLLALDRVLKPVFSEIDRDKETQKNHSFCPAEGGALVELASAENEQVNAPF